MSISQNLQFLLPALLTLWLVGIGVSGARFTIGEHERLVVFRLGRAIHVRVPGRVMLIPYIEQGKKFDITDALNARLIAAYETQLEQARQG